MYLRDTLKAALSSGDDFPSTWSNVALLVARVGLGLMMALGHGLAKLPPADGFINGVANLGFPTPALFAWTAGLSEFACSLLVALGLTTRLSSLAVCGTMLVAAFGAHASDPFAKKEFALVYFCAFLLCAAFGGGKYSLDHYVRRSP